MKAPDSGPQTEGNIMTEMLNRTADINTAAWMKPLKSERELEAF